MPERIEVDAPAKINLTLHVTGQRADGYHLLDSLVGFAAVHDRLTITRPARAPSLTVDGPEAGGVPADGTNLVLRAAALLGEDAAIHLRKTLPSAAGIGGGSADAAALVRGLVLEASRGTPGRDPLRAVLDRLGDLSALERLGADIPMCLTSKPQRVRGVGAISEAVDLPDLPALLVNPRAAVSTPEVFRALVAKANPPMPETLLAMTTVGQAVAFLSGMRNDLEAPACALQPVIAEVLDRLRCLPGARLARMSGSGATCFALFDDCAGAAAAARALATEKPGWWVRECVIGDRADQAAPRSVERVS